MMKIQQCDLLQLNEKRFPCLITCTNCTICNNNSPIYKKFTEMINHVFHCAKLQNISLQNSSFLFHDNCKLTNLLSTTYFPLNLFPMAKKF